MNKAYVYQIFSGKKYPSRDKVIALSFGLGLSAEEAQTLLKQAGYRELYTRDPRDALLLFALGKGMSILAANELLYDHEVRYWNRKNRWPVIGQRFFRNCAALRQWFHKVR